MNTKTLLIASILVVTACASAPDKKISGNYAVMVVSDPAARYRAPWGFPVDDVLSSLRERLGTVDLVDSADDASYDAIIVLRPHQPSRWPHVTASQTPRPRREVWNKEHSPEGPREAYGTGKQRFIQTVTFDIVRGGRTIGKGTARFEKASHEVDNRRTAVTTGKQQNYAAGIEIARAVAKALRTNG
jgi:hypothetical protein